MTYPETLTQKQERQSAWLTMPVHEKDGSWQWVTLNFTYIESDYAFRKPEMVIAADRPIYEKTTLVQIENRTVVVTEMVPVEDEDIICALKSFYSDKNITEIVIS